MRVEKQDFMVIVKTYHRNESRNDSHRSNRLHIGLDIAVKNVRSRRDLRSSTLLRQREDELAVLNDRVVGGVDCG
jgi:hypothetical protein